MTPSLPTLSIASAMIRPIVSSWFAEMVPTCAIIVPLTGFDIFASSAVIAATAFSMPRLMAIGLAPAVTFSCAFAIDRLRQDGGRRGAVAGNVRGLAGDFLHHLRAHVLERVLRGRFPSRP